jgi:prolipoprotein diacylglyceryltransferase
MLPRFLHGSQNRELYLITLKIFKKILDPADAKSFIAYLHHGDQLVAEGAYEILCFRGNEGVFFFIAEFFREPDEHLGLLSLGMSMGQWLCVPMIAGGVWLWVWANRPSQPL